MAVSLNKSRMHYSRFAMIIACIIVVFTKSFIPLEAMSHKILDLFGYFLIAFCALGRLYTTAFLGGFKNQNLITYGAFSVVRNPLYFFSLLGMTGIALMSGHIFIIIGLPIFFIILYHFLIAREEVLLEQTFGDDYRAYKTRVPRLIPNLSLYQAPEGIQIVPHYLNNAFRDAIWWFLALPVFEFIEHFQNLGVLKTWIMVP
jgi:protein-S-isoprenylcysteine O-methyltransferase Ste14